MKCILDLHKTVSSYTSALSRTENTRQPSLYVNPFLPLPSTGNMDGIQHICKWITGTLFFVQISVCKKKKKTRKRVWEGQSAPAITLFFSSLHNPEEDKLWGTQRGSATDLLGSSTSQQCIPAARPLQTHVWIATRLSRGRHAWLLFVQVQKKRMWKRKLSFSHNSETEMK